METHQKAPHFPRNESNSERDRIEQALRDLGHDAIGQSIAVLPAFDRPLEDVREPMKRALARRLEQFVADIRNDPENSPPTQSENLLHPSSSVVHACAACQGYCCNGGDTHAHLSRQTLTRVMANAHGISLDNIVNAYLERVPAQHYKGSCVYHTNQGCHLPRHLRSDTCNHFHCSGVQTLLTSEFDEMPEPIVAVALKGEKIVRIAVIQENKSQFLFGK